MVRRVPGFEPPPVLFKKNMKTKLKVSLGPRWVCIMWRPKKTTHEGKMLRINIVGGSNPTSLSFFQRVGDSTSLKGKILKKERKKKRKECN